MRCLPDGTPTEECDTCKGTGNVTVTKKRKKKSKRRQLTPEEIQAEEDRKSVAKQRFRSIAAGPNMFRPCGFQGKEEECVGPDPSYFLEHTDVDIDEEWGKAPEANWFRPTTIEREGKRCYYQIEVALSPGDDDGEQKMKFNCSKHVLVRNRIEEEALLGDPEAVHQCPHCREAFKKTSQLKTHVEKVHPDENGEKKDGDEEKITCPKCFYEFESKDVWISLKGECPNGCGTVDIE